MYRTSNTLSENIRMKAVELLNRHLAAAIDLHAQVKQAHWNVRGPAFIAIHELFDKVADLVEGYSDTIAERAAALGGTAQGTIHVAVERSFLKPYELGVAGEREHITAVTAALAAFGDAARKAIDEAAGSAIRTPPMFSPKCRAASTSNSGWSSRTSIAESPKFGKASAVYEHKAYIDWLRPGVGNSAPLLRCPKAVIGRRRQMEMPNGQPGPHHLRLGSRDAAGLCARHTRALGTGRGRVALSRQ